MLKPIFEYTHAHTDTPNPVQASLSSIFLLGKSVKRPFGRETLEGAGEGVGGGAIC